MPVVRIVACLGFLTALIVTVGCGKSEPKRYKVSGTVKWKGNPIPNGSITFLPEDTTGAAMGGAQIKDGQYEILATNGLTAGKYKVSISYPDPKGSPPPAKEGELPGESRLVKDLLPEKYNGATVLRAEVTPDGPNEFPFDLK
jgi:hypothetical protein